MFDRQSLVSGSQAHVLESLGYFSSYFNFQFSIVLLQSSNTRRHDTAQTIADMLICTVTLLVGANINKKTICKDMSFHFTVSGEMSIFGTNVHNL